MAKARRIQPITMADVKYLAHALARELLKWNEPIPDFGTRFPGKLESCLAAPFYSFAGKSFYRGLIPKAAGLFYVMIKNYPFQNGNKRIAMMTLFVFLHRNKKWLRVDEQELYNFAKWVAESPPRLKNETVRAAEKFFSLHLIDRNDCAG